MPVCTDHVIGRIAQMMENRVSKKKKLNNKGITLVELVVSFGLLAIFLATAAMCISHAVLFYYHQRQEMAAFTVADLAISEIREDIRSMQGSKFNGYIKVRKKDDSTGKLVGVSKTSGSYEGTTLEFVTSNIQDSAIAVQIDCEGCGSESTGIFSDAILINSEKVVNESIKNIRKDHITLRYYYKYPGEDLDGYEDLYMDKLLSDSSATKETAFSSYANGKNVVWHTLEKLPAESYQDFTIDLNFSVTPMPPDSEGNEAVSYVDVTVSVKNASGDEGYSKESRVDLLNEVYYKEEATMYSDM